MRNAVLIDDIPVYGNPIEVWHEFLAHWQ